MSFVRIAQLSDPHFGTILDGRIESLLATLKALSPSLILLTGDITQRARRKQFLQAKQFTEKLKPIPLIAVPGNHDIPLFNLPARIFSPYKEYKELFKDQLERDYIHGDVSVTCLNSTSKWRHIQGAFSIPRIQKRFQTTPSKSKVRIVAFHHPMDCSKPIDDKNLLCNRNESMKVFEQSQVDLILGGHIHDPYAGLSKVRYPQIQKSMVIAVAGTCLSWRTRKGAPNSFNLIDIESTADPKITITRYDLGEDCRFFAKANSTFQRTESLGWSISPGSL